MAKSDAPGLTYPYLSDGSGSEASHPSTPEVLTPPAGTPCEPATSLAKHGMTVADLVTICDKLVAIARCAGQMMLDADLSEVESDVKNNSSDRVTQVDKAIEAMVKGALNQSYPTFSFLGEETHHEDQKLTDTPTFVCDPIDGTLNFIHGFPNTGPSLALCIDKKPFVGVVFNPFRGDLFTAIKKQGAFLTNASGRTMRLPLKVAPAPLPSLNGCLVALEWGSERAGPNWALRSDMSRALLSSKAIGGAMVHSIRSSGSAALDFCYVASGQLDLFWEGGCWIWDVCAGWIILEEAGGMVAGANPGNWDPELEGRLYLAVRGAKKQEQEGVVRELWSLMGDRGFAY